MPKAGIVPNCRYGHGDMPAITMEDGSPPPWHAFVIQGVNVAGEGDGLTLAPVGGGLLLEAYQCKTCGYTELFDKDIEA